MHPFQRQRQHTPRSVKPTLQVVLKEGWRLVPKKRSFAAREGEAQSFKEVLPPRARVVPMTPALADAEPDELSEEERYLARQVQVILPQGADLEEYADLLRQSQAVEEVRLPPQLELP
jgi:hypothetical protein